ncbi:MAG: hypothetical protein ACLFUI_07990 [Halanaerobiales bacterium]
MKLSKSGDFIIENYQNQSTFSSFLPGIAGQLGTPIWAFYVNRGQGIASFGIENKDNAILEFQPANKSYQSVTYKGFRTFLRFTDKNNKIIVYEPFIETNQRIRSKMIVSPYSLTIEEENDDHQLIIRVKYFVLPGEDFGALVRRVFIENRAEMNREIEILDGLPEIVPSGLTNDALKEVSQTMSAWCRVYNLENGIPFYRVKATTDDSPEVRKMVKGHFYLVCNEKNKMLSPVVDPGVVFGMDNAFRRPLNFLNKGQTILQDRQMTENRFPSAMTAQKVVLEGNGCSEINSLFGHLADEGKLEEIKLKVLSSNYLDDKEEESKSIHDNITDNISTVSAKAAFDNYARQTFLDNILRGGYPVDLAEGGSEGIYHIYSRKHGDLERDYNYFHLEASYYSQGNGNYRDVNQNRRSENFFNPRVRDHNIKTFVNLIQADGYNPLVIKGSKYYLDEESFEDVLSYMDSSNDNSKEKLLLDRIRKPFTPGELSSYIQNHNIELNVDIEQFIKKVISNSESTIDAEFGEGFWVDHWTYILDLIENYLAVYPEKLKELLFEDNSYYFFDNYVRVKPRADKYLLTDLGPRQLNAVEEVEEKKNMIESRKKKGNQLRTKNGHGDIYNTTLMVKLLTLITNKISSLDPYGVGIEMEANKPGWYDALNGLPGIFGSSTPETMELKRLVDFLLENINKLDSIEHIKIPVEVSDFISGLNVLISNSMDENDDFLYWNKASSLREEYREKVFFGFDGAEVELNKQELVEYLRSISSKLESAVKRASQTDYDLYSTYYYYVPVEYEKSGKTSEEGYPHIHVNRFDQVVLPPFLEGQVRAMKVIDSKELRDLHESVRNSELFDDKLKMFRLNGDLSEMPDDIGRARAFTPGWLENGSIWLHMEYKYLLELLKNGLYKEFYQAIEDCLIPFQDPERYGRSILENSSFIMSSSNPDEENHGRGYIARLSGSTAEFLNIWSIMALGSNPFKIMDGELIFKPEPVLSSEFFTTQNEEIKIHNGKVNEKSIVPVNSFACIIFNSTLLVYHNPERIDTFPEMVIKGYKVTRINGEVKDIDRSYLDLTYSRLLRNGEIKRVDVYL